MGTFLFCFLLLKCDFNEIFKKIISDKMFFIGIEAYK